MEIIIGFAIIASIYVILAASLNILMGYTGIFSMAQGAIFGVGAYAAAILQTKFGFSFILALIGAIIIAGIISAIMAIPSLGVSGDYFIVASFGMQMLLFTLFMNMTDITNGSAGIQRIPRPEFFGYVVETDVAYLILTLIFTVLVLIFLMSVSRGGFGRVLRAIKEDESVVQSLGKNTKRAKIVVTVLSGCVAAVAGSLYAGYVTYINPNSFTVNESVFITTLVVLGGLRSWKGVTVGTVILLGLPELLKLLPFSDSNAAPIRQVLYGLLMIIFMIVRPQGIFGTTVKSKNKMKIEKGETILVTRNEEIL
jgi:branched-chain amino acid transport system permease protein